MMVVTFSIILTSVSLLLSCSFHFHFHRSSGRPLLSFFTCTPCILLSFYLPSLDFLPAKVSIIWSDQNTTDRLAVLAFNITVGSKTFAAAQLVDIPDSPVKAAVGAKT